MDLSVSWSRTICYHCPQEKRACAQHCVAETTVLSTSVERRRTSETRRCELPCNKHNKQAVNDKNIYIYTYINIYTATFTASRHTSHCKLETQAVVSTCIPTPAAHLITAWPRPFDLRVNASRGPAIEYMCTQFGVDRSSCFPFRPWTHTDTQTVTDTTDHSTHASATPASVTMHSPILVYILPSFLHHTGKYKFQINYAPKMLTGTQTRQIHWAYIRGYYYYHHHFCFNAIFKVNLTYLVLHGVLLSLFHYE